MHSTIRIRKDFFKKRRGRKRRGERSGQRLEKMGMERKSNTRHEHTIKCFLAIFQQVFFKMLLPVHCVNVFICLFACLFIRVLFSSWYLCAWKMIEGTRLHASIKSRSHHCLCCDSNDCFNYGSFSSMDAFVCWVQMLVFRRLWSSGRRFQMLDFFHFLLLYYCWYSGTPLRIFFPTTQILHSFMDSYALNYKYHLVYCVLCHWSPNVIRNIFQVRLAHERKELRIYFYSIWIRSQGQCRKHICSQSIHILSVSYSPNSIIPLYCQINQTRNRLCAIALTIYTGILFGVGQKLKCKQNCTQFTCLCIS